VLNGMFDYVVVDVGSGVGGRTGEILEMCDEMLVVTGLEAAAMRNTAGYLKWLNRIDIPKDRIRLIVNRHQDEGVSNEDLEASVHTEVFWALPNDYRPMRHAMDARDPVILDSPGSRLARSYRGLATTLCEIHAEADLLGTVEERSKRAGDSAG
jgi:pilus assembly protein CpaE